MTADLSDRRQLRSVLEYRPWSEVLYGGSLTDVHHVVPVVQLIDILVNLVPSCSVIPLVVVTGGVFSRNCSPTAAPSTSFPGWSIWGLVRSARLEMPKLSISCIDVDPSFDLDV
jgi:hypothetical protein